MLLLLLLAMPKQYAAEINEKSSSVIPKNCPLATRKTKLEIQLKMGGCWVAGRKGRNQLMSHLEFNESIISIC